MAKPLPPVRAAQTPYAKILSALVLGTLLGAIVGWRWLGPHESLERLAPTTSDYARLVTEQVDVSIETDTSLPPEGSSADIYLMMEQMAEIPSEFRQRAVLYQFAAELSAPQLVEAIDYSDQLFGLGDAIALGSILVSRLAELEPDEAVDAVLWGNFLAQSIWIQDVFRVFARADLEYALERARVLPTKLRPYAARALLEFAEDLSSEERWEISQSLGLRSVPVTRSMNFAQAWSDMVANQKSTARMQYEHQLFAEWVKVDPEAALRAAQQGRGVLREAAVGQVLTNWATHDFAGALDWLAQQSPSDQLESYTQSIYSGVGESDRELALSHLDSLSGRPRQLAIVGLAQTIGGSDPELIHGLMSQLDSNQKVQALQSVAWNLGSHGPEAVERFVEPLSAEETQLVLYTTVSFLAYTDAASAAELVDSLDSAERIGFAESVVSGWVHTDLAKTREWIADFPPEQQSRLNLTMVVALAERDLPTALALSENMASGEQRDDALVAIVGSNSGRLRESAKLSEVLGTIIDAEKRLEAATQAYQYFSHTDPVEADLIADEFGLQIPQEE